MSEVSAREAISQELVETVAASAPLEPASVVGTFRTLTVVGVLQVVTLAVVLTRSKTLALFLRPEGVGIVGTVDQLAQFIAQLSALSLSAAPVRFVARSISEGAQQLSATYQALLKPLLLTTAIGVASALLLVAMVPGVLGPGLRDYRTLAALAISTVPFISFSTFFANVIASVQGFGPAGIYLLISALGSLAAAVVGIRVNGIEGLYIANLLVGVLTVGAVAVYVRTRLNLKSHTKSFNLSAHLRAHPEIWRYCATTYVLAFAQPLAFLILRSQILQSLGASEAGYFQAAFAVSSVASMVLMQGIRAHLEPKVNRATSPSVRMAVANEFQRAFIILVLLGTLPIVLFPRQIVSLLFTREFAPISALLFMFVIADSIFLCAQVYAVVVISLDDFRGFFRAHLAGYVSLCVLGWILTPRYGLVGIALSFLLSRLLQLVWVQQVLARHRLRVTPAVVGAVVYAFGALALVGLVLGPGAVSGAEGIVGRVAAYVAIASGTLLFTSAAERTWLKGLWRRLEVPTSSSRAALVLVFSVLIGTFVAGAGRSPRNAADRLVLQRLPDGGIQPQAVVDHAGTVHIVYFSGDALAGDIWYVRRAPEGTLSRPLRVNSQSGSAVAAGSVRGGQLALGRGNRVHVVWNGSDRVQPKPRAGMPLLYSRLNDSGDAFEPKRTLVSTGLDGGATVAADARGFVLVSWHANPTGENESGAGVYLTQSDDDGRTFVRERLASDPGLGACGCCSMRALVGHDGSLYLLYRAATNGLDRDTVLLSSGDQGATFATSRLHSWKLQACPLSSMSLAEGPSGVAAAWETRGQIFTTRVSAPTGGPATAIESPPGGTGDRKHPVLTYNESGERLLAWLEGTGWARGGSVAWQLYGADGRALGGPGSAKGVPPWGLAAAAPLSGGRFLLLY